ncbi:hypothetical protein LCGC14_0215400 [marine sediment metagenome]
MLLASDILRLWQMPLWTLTLVSTMASADRPRVVLDKVTTGPFIEEIALNGTATALRRSDVSVSIPGLVLERMVEIGDRVEQGDPLLRLDDELAHFEHDRAAAETREAESRLAEARRLVEEARSVGAGRNIAATEVSRRESEGGAAEAALARATAVQQLQRARVDRHSIEAPIGGIVSARSVEVGQWVEPGVPVLTLVDTDALRLDFQVPQRALATLNAASTLSIDSLSDTISALADIAVWLPVTDDRSRTFLLRAKPPENLVLVPGMAVSATLRLVKDEQALSVHRDAVNRYPEGRITAWVARPADNEGVYTVTEQRIQLAGAAGDQVFVSEGLNGSELVVSRGNESLREGAEVVLAGQEQ